MQVRLHDEPRRDHRLVGEFEHHLAVRGREPRIGHRSPAPAAELVSAPRDQALRELQAQHERLQRALRRRLMEPLRAPFLLNSRDPLGAGSDFSELDAMADALWGATG